MHFLKICGCFFFLLVTQVTGQGQINEANWMVQLTEEILEETDLCERCTWVNPTLSYVRFNDSEFIFLRYSCSTTESFARMYNLDGTVESECVSRNGTSECGFGGNAFTVYTFADTILNLWNCTTGFDCEFALENNIELKVPIAIEDTRCTEGIKMLRASDEFETYNWAGNNQTGNNSTLEITEGGTYFLTVTDEMGCRFDGEVNVPDITKLAVSIKGPAQFCLGTTVTLQTTNFQTYKWSSGERSPNVIANQAGMYQVTVTNAQNCQGVASFLLENFDPLVIEIIADQTKVFEGNPVNISIRTNPANQAFTIEEWTSNSRIDCTTCPETTYFPTVDNELMVAVIDENGCRSSATFSILVEELPVAVYAPNVFKLNSALQNDWFTLYGGTNVERIESLAILDRLGNLVYQKKNFLPNELTAGWNGQIKDEIAPQAIYLYQAMVKFVNGDTKIITGDVLFLH